MTKSFLRKEFLVKRMLLNEAEQQKRIDNITARLAKIQLHKAAFILSYIALAAKKEITPVLVEKLITQQFPNCRLCYPKIDTTNKSMEAVELAEGHTMGSNKWGIAEPENGNIISPKQLDIILLPLLCFDKRGYRVGYGKGFYDRYITRCRPDVMTIGLSFFEPVDSIDDVNEYDVPMKYCVTPEKLYQF